MRKSHLSLIVILIAVLSLTAFISCENETKVVTYHVIVKNGDETVKEKDVADGDTFTLPAAPSDSTQTFEGWLVGANLKQPGEDITITGDIIITAQWKDICIVKFDTAGGAKLSSLGIPYGSRINFAGTPEAPTRTGYTFTGWTLKGQAFSFDQKITENITLTANWTINKYNVSFDLGYDSTTSIGDQEVEYNKTATKPDAPTRTGHIFDGWKVKNGGVFDFWNPITSDTVLVAQWSEIKTNLTLLFPRNVNLVDTLVVKIGSQEKKFEYSDGTADGDYLKFTATVTGLDYGKYTITVETKNSEGNKVGTSHSDTLILNSLTTDKTVTVDKSVIVNITPVITAKATSVTGTTGSYVITGTASMQCADNTTVKYSTDGSTPTEAYTSGNEFDVTNSTTLSYTVTYTGTNWCTGDLSYSGKIDTDIPINTIGAKGPAGGIIFYDEKTVKTYSDYSWRFFEASSDNLTSCAVAPSDGAAYYGCSADRGRGKDNTKQLKTLTNYAAAKCLGYSVTVGGVAYSDWFLPSSKELYEMIKANALVGKITTHQYYASSSVSGSVVVDTVLLKADGTISSTSIDRDYSGLVVRPVRCF